MTRLAVGCVLLVALSGCAAKRDVAGAAASVPTTPHVDVDALLRRGCFHCFEQALTAAQAAGDTRRAFEAAALVVLRAKELGLSTDDRVATLRSLVPVEPGWSDVLDIVLAVPSDPLSGERYARPFANNVAPRRRARQIVDAWGDTPDVTPAPGWFRSYIALAVACSLTPPAGETAGVTARKVRDAWPAAPALQFVAGACVGDPALLAPLRTADPEFVDVEYPLGRIAGEGRIPDYDESLRHLEAARAAFPDSIAVTTALGNLRLQREEWMDALTTFDEVIARAPLHRDALLGRVVALSRLARHDEAIAGATHMIELGEWLLGPAYYWRAFNELQAGSLDAAASDRDRAKTLMSNAAVYLLSGLIEWRLKRLQSAETEFQQALVLDFGQCDAALYMAAVRSDMGTRPEAVAAFKQAIQCYDLSIAVRTKAIDDIRAGGGSESAKASLIARQQRAIAEATSHRDQATRGVATLEKSL